MILGLGLFSAFGFFDNVSRGDWAHTLGAAVGWIVIVMVMSLAAWNVPTYESFFAEASTVGVGSLYANDVVGTSRTGENLYSGARFVTQVFVHYGRKRSIMLALSDGTARLHPRGDDIRVLARRDVFQRIRPESAEVFRLAEPRESTMAVLAVIWDVLAAGYGAADLAYIAEQVSDRHPDEVRAELERAAGLRLVTVTKRGVVGTRSRFYALTVAGEIHLMAFMRQQGVELDPDAEERALTNINYGNVFNNSPGSAGVVGSGDAVVNNEQLTVQVEKGLRALAAALDSADLAGLDDLDSATVGAATRTITTELAQPEPDLNRLKRAVRLIPPTVETVVLGALGSGTWDMLSRWAGLG